MAGRQAASGTWLQSIKSAFSLINLEIWGGLADVSSFRALTSGSAGTKLASPSIIDPEIMLCDIAEMMAAAV